MGLFTTSSSLRLLEDVSADHHCVGSWSQYRSYLLWSRLFCLIQTRLTCVKAPLDHGLTKRGGLSPDRTSICTVEALNTERSWQQQSCSVPGGCHEKRKTQHTVFSLVQVGQCLVRSGPVKQWSHGEAFLNVSVVHLFTVSSSSRFNSSETLSLNVTLVYRHNPRRNCLCRLNDVP